LAGSFPVNNRCQPGILVCQQSALHL